MAFSSFPQMNDKVAYVTDMPDDPSSPPDNWSVEQIKQEFDKGPVALKTFVNVLVTALNNFLSALAANTAATNIGAKITVEGEQQDVTLQQAIDAAMESSGDIPEGAVSSEYTGTLTTSGWTASEGDVAPYTQKVTISGVLDTDSPIIDLVASDTYSTAVAEDGAWSKIYKAVAGSGTITFYAKEEPTVALNFKARCIRK